MAAKQGAPFFIWDEAFGDPDKSALAAIGAKARIGEPLFIMVTFTPIIVRNRIAPYQMVVVGDKGYAFFSGLRAGYDGGSPRKTYEVLRSLGVPDPLARLVFSRRQVILYNRRGKWYADPVTSEIQNTRSI